MSVFGFVSGGSSVVLRCGSDGVVWGFRACSAGSRPAPACLFVPFGCSASASAWGRSVAVSLGWRVWVRRARRCASAFECKVALPSCVSASSARALLPGVCWCFGAGALRLLAPAPCLRAGLGLWLRLWTLWLPLAAPWCAAAPLARMLPWSAPLLCQPCGSLLFLSLLALVRLALCPPCLWFSSSPGVVVGSAGGRADSVDSCGFGLQLVPARLCRLLRLASWCSLPPHRRAGRGLQLVWLFSGVCLWLPSPWAFRLLLCRPWALAVGLLVVFLACGLRPGAGCVGRKI